MSFGIAVPLRAAAGRLVTTARAEQVAKLVLLSVMDGDSANPFARDVGVRAPLFEVDAPATRALVQQAVEQRLKRLERDDKAKLSEIAFVPPSGNGELAVRVTWIDLETDAAAVVTRTVRRTA